jgi:U3 small nucleolar RNA-associated protein 22
VGLLVLLVRREEPCASDSKYTRRRPLGKGLSFYQLLKDLKLLAHVLSQPTTAKHPFGKSPVFVKAKDADRVRLQYCDKTPV